MVRLKRGDVCWVDFEPVVGSEQGGVRPAVVVQNDVGNRFSPTTIVAAVTTKTVSKPFPFIVSLPPQALPRASAVDCAQIRTIDRARLRSEPIAHLDESVMREVDDALRASLGLY